MPRMKYGFATLVLFLGGCGDGTGTGGDGGLGGSSGCNLSCLNTLVSLMQGCQPTGTCVEQLSGTTVGNACYSNGIKLQVSMTTPSTGGTSMSMSVKKGSAVCYSMVMNETAAGDMTMAFKNASGVAVATMGTTTTGGSTITCPGGSPSVIDSTCSGQANSANSMATPSTDCTQGACAY